MPSILMLEDIRLQYNTYPIKFHLKVATAENKLHFIFSSLSINFIVNQFYHQLAG